MVEALVVFVGLIEAAGIELGAGVALCLAVALGLMLIWHGIEWFRSGSKNG